MKTLRRTEPWVLRCIQAAWSDELANARELLQEYAATPDIGVCFKGFEEEVESLPGMYAPPEGRVLLAFVDDEAAGCVGFRKLESGVSELWRLYVRPRYRGKRLGRELAEAIIQQAREAGYHTERLATLPVMKEAIALYRSLGFARGPTYEDNALEGAIYMELSLG